MPTEIRQRTTTTKPLTPTLSSNLRTRPAHGLTPRLAAAGPASPASQPPRSLRQQTLSPPRNDETNIASLSSNITPRSGARVSRLDTESPSTPDTAARSKAITEGGRNNGQTQSYGLGISSPQGTPTQPRPKSIDQLSFLPTANGKRLSGGSTLSAKNDSKFFRADDVKPAAVRPCVTRSKTSYISQSQSPRLSPEKVSPDDQDQPDDKYVYTRSAAWQQSAPDIRSILASTMLSASIRSSPTASVTNSPTASHFGEQKQVATVPVEVNTAKQSSRQRSSSSTQTRTISAADRRRSSSLNLKPIVTEASKSHRKSLSAESAKTSAIGTRSPHETKASCNDLVASTTASTRTGPSAPWLMSTSPTTPRSESVFSVQTTATSMTSNHSKPGVQPTRPQFVSRHTRGSSEATALQPITKEQIEAAATARRERKVLDLEISNSSLLAINRTLEKELKKHNTELRRFRRLSRSGRLSLTASHRIVSGASMSTLATLDEGDGEVTQTTISPPPSDFGSLDGDEDFLSDDESAYTESSEAMRRRARDEKRLMQDLQRHQQILLDSQKLTQSIQRCLNFTDELIKDGTKALAYQVEPDEVRVGGRVLSHDDNEALSEVDFDGYQESMVARPRQGLLSPSVVKDALEEAAMWVNASQALDGSRDAPRILQDQPTAHSPSPEPDLSPVLLPGR